MTVGLDDAAEQQFGPYVVYERLGVGGMATVHRARERGIEGFERIVALKRLLPHLAEDASFIKAFVREAKLASMLDHTNIVKIFELGRVGTEYFISMEYIEGRDIRRILRHARKVTGPPPIHIIVGILLQLCDALDYAHTRADEHGRPLLLVHRDVSPSNVIVSTTGQVKVIDFGIAKAQTQKHRTQTGRVKGKLAYLAPEAVTGRGELDARSDLFAAGVIAHELLTARPLFASKNEYDTLIKVQRAEVRPPSTLNASCPPELDDIVLRALERERDERYPSAAAMRDDLMRLRQQYALQTSGRDVALWVDWAFAEDTHDPDESVIELVNRRTPAPRAEDDDAVEIAWGSGEPERGGPIVLEDVPDVSEKHRAPHLFDDDDVPTPAPSHGSRSGRQAPTLAEPDEDFDAPLDLAPDPTRAQRISEPRISSRPRLGSQLATAPEGHALLDALDEANLAAETLRGMHAQGPDTLPSMPAAPARPSDELAFDDVAPPPAPTPEPPARTSSSVITSAPRADAPPVAEPPAVEPPADAPHADDPPTRPIVLVPLERDTTLDDDEPPTAQVALRPTPAALPAQPPSRPTPSSRPTPVSGPHVVPRTSSGPHTVRRTSSGPHVVPRATSPRSAQPAPQPSESVVRFKRPTAAPATPDEALAPTWPSTATPPSATKTPTTPPANVAVGGKTPTTPPANKPPTYPPPTYEVPLGLPLNTPVKTARTRPGHAPAPAPATPIPMPHERAPSQFGAALIERSQRRPSRWVRVVIGVAVTAAIASALLFVLTRGDKKKELVPPPPATTPAPPPTTAATLKLVTEPADAEISIENQPSHSGAPWSTELAPGTYQIQITHAGYKSWLTSLELSAHENYTLRVVLEKLPPASSAAKTFATLILSSTPSGLDAELDGKLLPMKTPIRMPLSIGPHSIALRKDGAVVWHQELEASAAVDYEFNPSMEPAKQRERNERAPAPRATFTPRPAPVAPPPPTPAAPLDAAPLVLDAAPPPDAPITVDAPPPLPTPLPTPTKVSTPPAPPPPKPAAPAPKPAAPAPAPKPSAPITVPPNAVTKVSGATPQLNANASLPSVAAAKLCIDAAGRVTSATLITKLDARSAADLTSTLKTWAYAPYKNQPVCFAVSLRLK